MLDRVAVAQFELLRWLGSLECFLALFSIQSVVCHCALRVCRRTLFLHRCSPLVCVNSRGSERSCPGGGRFDINFLGPGFVRVTGGEVVQSEFTLTNHKSTDVVAGQGSQASSGREGCVAAATSSLGKGAALSAVHGSMAQQMAD